MSSLPRLDEAFATYKATSDALRMARRATLRGVDLKSSYWADLPSSEVPALMDRCADHLADSVIVAMFAMFERRLLTAVADEVSTIARAPASALSTRTAAQALREAERWRMDELLDLLTDILSPRSLGDLRNVKRYRDWVAHRNPKRPPPARLTPETAYSVLRAAVEALDSLPPRRL